MLNIRIFGKHLNHLVYPKKISVVQTNAIEDNKRLKNNLKSVAQTFAKFYSESLLRNPTNSANKFDMNSVDQYYKKIELKDNFNLTLTTENKVLEVLQCIDISKAATGDEISGRFFKRWCKYSGKNSSKNI